MQLFRIVKHGRDGSTSYVQVNGSILAIPEEKAKQYVDWLYKMNGRTGSQFFVEEQNEQHTNT